MIEQRVRDLVIHHGIGPEDDAEGLVRGILALVAESTPAAPDEEGLDARYQRLLEAYERLLRARHDTAHNGDLVGFGDFDGCPICSGALRDFALASQDKA